MIESTMANLYMGDYAAKKEWKSLWTDTEWFPGCSVKWKNKCTRKYVVCYSYERDWEK